MTPLLSVRGLVAGYGGVPVIADVDLDVQPDTFLAVLGANGAGKTTTLRALMGLCDVLGGSVAFNGRALPPRTADRVRAGLVMCPEGREVFPTLSVEENLLTGALAARRWRERAEDLAQVYDLLPRLRERRHQAAGTMSGGEQQQLALARALMSKPRLLLVDETSLGLSPAIVERVFGILAAIHRAGTAIIAVEQVLAISSIATEIVVLDHGTIGRRIPASEFGTELAEVTRTAYFGRGEP